VSTELEEVAARGDPAPPEQAPPDPGDELLGRGPRGLDRLVGLVGARRAGEGRQRGPIELAVGGQGQALERDERGRDHGLGELRPEVGAELRGGGRGGVADDVRDQRLVADDRGGGGDAGVPAQGGLDLAELDPVAAQLDLAVPPAEEDERAIGAQPDDVAGAVEAAAGGAPGGVRHEARGGELRAAQVAPGQAGAPEVQLPGHADRHGVAMAVPHVDLEVADRPPDRHGRVAGAAAPGGDVDRRLGGPVEVVQLGAEARKAAVLDLGRQRLAAAEDAAEGRAPAELALLQEHPQHGGHEVQRGDAVARDGVDEVRAVAVAVGPRHDEPRAGQERPEQLPHRDVEAERRLLEHAILGAQEVGVLHPQEPVADRPVRRDDALGPAGRAGGVDDVGRVIGPGGGGGARRRPRAERREPVVVHDDPGPGVRQHEAAPLVGVARIERQVRPAGLEGGQERDHQLDRALQADADQRLRPDPEGAQAVRELTGARVERPVAQAGGLVGDGDRIGRARDLGLDELVEADLARIRDLGCPHPETIQ
jgi:hypothetical protein